MKLTDTKILLSNYPNMRQEVPFGQVGGKEVIDIQLVDEEYDYTPKNEENVVN